MLVVLEINFAGWGMIVRGDESGPNFYDLTAAGGGQRVLLYGPARGVRSIRMIEQ
jgi:hypothetical protein